MSFWFAALLVSLVVAGIGAAVYLSARRAVLESVHQNLESIARIKVGQIERWLADAHRQADLALNSPLFVGEFERWIAGGMPDAGRPRLLKHLQATAAAGRFRDVGLRSPLDGRLLLSTDPDASDEADRRGRARLAATDQAPVLEDFRPTHHGRAGIGVGFHAPIGHPNAPPMGVVHVELDPAVHLLPFLNQWPGASPSAETLLFRIDDAEIVYLNHSRHEPHAALAMRMPVGAAMLMSGQVARGARGALSGVDYRGVDSLGFVLPVAGTPWHLIGKLDKSEALAALNRTSLLAAAAAGCLMLMFVAWKMERSRHIEAEYRTLFERALLSRRLEFLARYANDGILLADTDGRIIEVNELCTEIYGYRREEMLGMQLAELWSQPGQPAGGEVMPVDDVVYEAEHRRKDGSAIAVEVSSRMIDIDGARRFQALVRDNRQRKQYERSLRESEERFRLTFDHAPIGMLMLALDGRILAVNAAGCALSGYSRAELLRMTMLDVTHLDDRAAEDGWLDRLIASKSGICMVANRIWRKDGSARHTVTNRTLVRDAGGNPLHVVAQVRDVTEERRAAERIERLSQLKTALSEINHAIVHSESPAEVFRAVCRACVDRGGFRLAWVGVPDPDSQRILPIHSYGPGSVYLDGIVVSADPGTPEGQGPASLALRGRRYYCNDIANDARFAPWRERAQEHGLASAIALTLLRGGQPWGVLAGYGGETDCFDDEAVDMLESMADNISFALDQFDREGLRRQAEGALRMSEQRATRYAQELDDLYQNAPCGYHSCDANGLVRRMNDTELRWLGYSRDEVVDRLRVVDLLDEPGRTRFAQLFQAFMHEGQVHDLELTFVRKDGTSLPVMLSATAIYDEDGRFLASRTTVRDVTRLKDLERDRERQAHRLQQLSHHLVAVQEEERRRLACELQDRASPNLAAIKLTLDTLMHALPDTRSADAEACLSDARALLDDTISGVREVCADLRPSMLDYAGLVPAVVGYTQQYTRRTGIAVSLKLPGEKVRFGAEMESTLFRIIQEALSNVVRHAKAGSAEVALDCDQRRTVLVVRDDGVGFDNPVAPDGGGRGLRAMRQRAEFSGGSMYVVSSPGKGTEIRVEVLTPRDTSDSPWHKLVAADAKHTLQ